MDTRPTVSTGTTEGRVVLTPSDADLVQRAVGGSRAAFDQLIVRYQRQAVAVSYRLLGNTADAVEVTQDAFLKAYRSLSTLQTPAAFGGWLLRTVSNLSLNHRRSRKGRAAATLDGSHDLAAGGPGAGDPSTGLQGRELGVKISAALATLPEKQRQALLLFTVDGLPQKDVAETLNCSVEAVKWHVFQGRKRLRELLKDQLED